MPCSINLGLYFIIFFAVALTVARSFLPEDHLVGPVIFRYGFVFGKGSPELRNRNMIEGILAGEVVPEDKDGSQIIITQIIIPFLKSIDDLVTLFADRCLGDVNKLHLSVDHQESVLLFFCLGDHRQRILKEG